MNATGWLTGLRVTTGGTAVVSHAGVALLRALSDDIGLTSGLSRALTSNRLLVHDLRPGAVGPGVRDRRRRGGDQRLPGDRRPGRAVRPGRLGADLLGRRLWNPATPGPPCRATVIPTNLKSRSSRQLSASQRPAITPYE